MIAADPNPERRKIALSHGADYAFDPMDKDFPQQVLAVTGGKGVNGVIEVCDCPASGIGVRGSNGPCHSLGMYSRE